MMIRHRLRAFLRWTLRVLVSVVLLSILAVGVLRWVDPPRSAVMVWHSIGNAVSAGEPPPLYHEWVAWREIPAPVALAVIAAEDQRFPQHTGFDLIELRAAWTAFQDGGQLRGASTISQQTAKNLFLWPGRDYLRKGLEAWFTVLIEAFWPKQRILEVYLNIAQFSPDTYGVGAASSRYLKRPLVALGDKDAALLAAVLPNPLRYRLDAPSASVQRRAEHIRKQMRQLGGTAYLQRF